MLPRSPAARRRPRRRCSARVVAAWSTVLDILATDDPTSGSTPTPGCMLPVFLARHRAGAVVAAGPGRGDRGVVGGVMVVHVLAFGAPGPVRGRACRSSFVLAFLGGLGPAGGAALVGARPDRSCWPASCWSRTPRPGRSSSRSCRCAPGRCGGSAGWRRSVRRWPGELRQRNEELRALRDERAALEVSRRPGRSPRSWRPARRTAQPARGRRRGRQRRSTTRTCLRGAAGPARGGQPTDPGDMRGVVGLLRGGEATLAPPAVGRAPRRAARPARRQDHGCSRRRPPRAAGQRRAVGLPDRGAPGHRPRRRAPTAPVGGAR